ncbi:MAG: nickel-dependent lactate racemase [Methanomassiliicoccales archaeon]|nr:MAG: nickel-dependent lactate racemase [Methanomassiliicoccales archaeon]
MKLEIPYCKDLVKIEIPDEHVTGIVRPNDVKIGDERETIFKAIENPINSKSFSDFLSDAKDVLFIVNDGTRPTPTSKILDILHEKFQEKDVKFIVATGVHRAPTEEELEFIFGKHLKYLRDRIFIHDAKREEDMVFIGTSKNGTEMYVNRLGVEAHKIVIISSVEPHYFAGYTGGRKSFLPGIASRKTIEQNHRYAMRDDAQPLVLEGNPVNEDMEDAILTIQDKEIFSIMAVLDRHQSIYATCAGHIYDSFHAAIEKANEVFAVPIKEKADIVVSVAPYPMDIDLYQSQKAIENGKMALKDGGIIILVSKCRDGIGDETFFKLLASSSDAKEVLDTIEKGYRLGFHKAARIVDASLKGEIWAVTDLEDDIIQKAFMKPYPSVQEAVDSAISKIGPDAKVLFLLDGSVTVPVIRG